MMFNCKDHVQQSYMSEWTKFSATLPKYSIIYLINKSFLHADGGSLSQQTFNK